MLDKNKKVTTNNEVRTVTVSGNGIYIETHSDAPKNSEKGSDGKGSKRRPRLRTICLILLTILFIIGVAHSGSIDANHAHVVVHAMMEQYVPEVPREVAEPYVHKGLDVVLHALVYIHSGVASAVLGTLEHNEVFGH